MEVIGIERVNYVSKKTGQQVVGKRLHMCYEKENAEGFVTINEFVSDKVGCDVKVNDKVELFYNKFGQVSQVVVL